MEDPREGRRLAAKVDTRDWAKRYLDESVLNGKHPIRPSGAVLEVGCGPAVLLAEVNRRRPDLHCVGIDAGARRLAALERHPQVQLAAARAECLPFRDASFDLVYCRMVLEYLPAPERAIAEMVRVCRPDGTVLLQDLDGQLVQHYPPDANVDAAVSAVVTALATTGFDPHVGRRLFGLAQAAGLMDINVAMEGYHVIAGRIDPTRREQWVLKLGIAKPAIVAALGPVRADTAIQQFMDYLDRKDTLTFSTQFTVMGRRGS
jgi:SAM-dependent methyltransferase